MLLPHRDKVHEHFFMEGKRETPAPTVQVKQIMAADGIDIYWYNTRAWQG